MHFKYKLLIAFLLVALVPIGIIGEYSILSSTKALTNKALEELETVSYTHLTLPTKRIV